LRPRRASFDKLPAAASWVDVALASQRADQAKLVVKAGSHPIGVTGAVAGRARAEHRFGPKRSGSNTMQEGPDVFGQSLESQRTDRFAQHERDPRTDDSIVGKHSARIRSVLIRPAG